MRSVLAWSDRVVCVVQYVVLFVLILLQPQRDGQSNVVWDLCFSPGHRDSVYCVDYSRDGQRFASGGADNTVIIWTAQAEGRLKYSHNDTIQKLAYNPVTAQLASCTATDFGLWSPEQKSVQKHKVPSKILSASWTTDGQFIAVGMLNGQITIRDKSGAEKAKIERSAPIWTLAWNPSRDEPFDVLAVGCWDQTLSFYQLSGNQHGKDRELGYDPCSVSYTSNGDYLVVAGSDRKATLMTKDGISLGQVAEREEWVWAAKAKPGSHFVAVGCNDGTIAMSQLVFSTVHGLYQDRYAYRDNMTDVIVQHLITEQRVRIKCRDYVKKIAVYKDRLAVQVPDRITIYELSTDDAFDMRYRVRRKISKKLDCNLLVVTSLHVILCLERKLQLYTFDGNKEREWVLEAVIRYIKVVGGPAGQEGLLVGLKNGVVLKIFVDNPFPIQLIRQKTAVRCLDLSASRRKLAVVDERNMCMVYDLTTSELLFEEPDANSVAWNTEMEDMLCFSGSNLLSIKTGTFPVHQQKLQGFVVGFNGSKIFCLHFVAMQTIDVPQSASLYRYIDGKDWDMAYQVACLGVTETDWRLLAMSALRAMKLDIARKSFIRVRDMRYIDLINNIEQAKRTGSANDAYHLAKVMAFDGKFQEAAKLFVKSAHAEKAIEMFTDLRRWDEAKKFAQAAGTGGGNMDIKDLMARQAEWNEQVGDSKSAAEMYLACGNVKKAIELNGERGWYKQVVDIARGLEASDEENLRLCAKFLIRGEQYAMAKEALQKIGDVQGLMELHVKLHEWEEAFKLADANKGKFSSDVFLPYAEWLITQDKFDDAQEAFIKAGRADRSQQILQHLTHNAVVERRFRDAAHHFTQLVTTHGSNKDQRSHALLRAEVYNAYQYIYEFAMEPFSSTTPSTLFNAARFLVNAVAMLGGKAPYGVSMAAVLYTLGKQAKSEDAYQLARQAFDRLRKLKYDEAWRAEVEMSTLSLQGKPFTDPEALLAICFRCGAVNPLINLNSGDRCVNCGHPFIRCQLTLDILPLVEFRPRAGITMEEAISLLEELPMETGPRGSSDGWQEGTDGNADTMRFDDGPSAGGNMNGDEMFNALLGNAESMAGGDGDGVVEVDERMLAALDPSEVYIVRGSDKEGPVRLLKNTLTDIPVIMTEPGFFFHQDEFETAILRDGYSPITRLPAEKFNESEM